MYRLTYYFLKYIKENRIQRNVMIKTSLYINLINAIFFVVYLVAKHLKNVLII